ncbi:methylenetetrahydrofolate reductase [Roseixanthobacter glucoisosaccharinicivorans]|uniref:methylenetetrahydrofolate reductase n=1 Tax=Roseixanthobacter glucoisosaccharinicivorans TaxID=3119923 RepID=UPI00372CB805
MQIDAERRDAVREAAAPAARADGAALAQLVKGLSFELSPKEALRNAHALGVPSGTRTFITRLPKGSFEETLEAAVVLKQAGLQPVPHVTVRTVPDAVTLEQWLRRFVREAGVEEILLIAGSQERALGAFGETTDILASGVIEGAGLRAVSFAGHPEGHPVAGADALQRAIDGKNEFALRTGLSCALVTQFFFDAAPVIAWEKQLREGGNRLPVDPGLHGVTGVPSLLKHALACGIGASVKALSAHGGGGILQFAQIRTPDALARAIASAVAKDPDSLFRSFHLFPLGGLAKTVEWMAQVRHAAAGVASAPDVPVARA